MRERVRERVRVRRRERGREIYIEGEREKERKGERGREGESEGGEIEWERGIEREREGAIITFVCLLFSHTGNTDTGNTSGCLPPESGFLEYSKHTSKGNYESEGNKVTRLQMRLTG